MNIGIGAHALYLHDSQMLWSRPTSSENSVASASVILNHLVIDVVIVLAVLRFSNLLVASQPMCLSQTIRPFRSDQNVSVTTCMCPPLERGVFPRATNIGNPAVQCKHPISTTIRGVARDLGINGASGRFRAHTGAQEASEHELGDFGNNPTPY